jgi:sialic acid synthase SpsE
LLKLGVKLFKTASADLVDLPLQRYIASTGKPTIVATGMASLGEIDQVVDLYEEAGNPNLVLLHCVSNYPCSAQSINLRAMNTLAQAFSLPVGFSDHSEGFLAAVIAASMGAKVIEKHFTLDKAMSGPDHRASSTPEEFAQLVQNVRQAEVMLGSPRKTCQSEERQMATVSRKSIVLARSMQVGEEITLSDIRMMRPGTGLGANLIPKVVGQKLRTDLDVGHQLTWADLV